MAHAEYFPALHYMLLCISIANDLCSHYMIGHCQLVPKEMCACCLVMRAQ